MTVVALGSNNLLSRYLLVDHGEPQGLLHERAYIPIDSWRAQACQGPEHPEHFPWHVCSLGSVAPAKSWIVTPNYPGPLLHRQIDQN